MSLLWVLLFVIQALLHSALGKATGFSTNVGIFGGKEIEIKDAPYMAALFHDDNFLCGGSIIHDWFILTSAYCCGSYKNGQIVNNVHIGSSDIYRNGTTIKVTHVVPHAGFVNIHSGNNNICLLKLQDRVPIHCNIAKVNLERTPIHEDSLVKITGWGLPDEHGNYPDKLRQAAIPVVSEETCRSLFPDKTKSSFCAGSPGKDFCDGDMGGPLTLNNVQVGIASIARGSCGENSALYTKVSSFKTWIDTKIQHHMKKKN